jgi:hypothetical protein
MYVFLVSNIRGGSGGSESSDSKLILGIIYNPCRAARGQHDLFLKNSLF